MLVLVLSVAIVGAVTLEIALHHFRNHYEIEWIAVCEIKETSIADEIVQTMRRQCSEAERQMNAPFKVASHADW
ncbi:hypothetical protein [Rhizobium sp. RAF56]|jgi:hypothetical protein|uniref:hypothetical protein n=1 Tax=Rhizobium sp. RAF56 TaxID=3233062 RepID=UPI003F96AA4A